MGILDDTLAPWIQHAAHGWLWIQVGETGLFFYDPSQDGLGWAYTTPSLYPIIYQFCSQSWLQYLTNDTSGYQWFWNFNTESYLSFP